MAVRRHGFGLSTRHDSFSVTVTCFMSLDYKSIVQEFERMIRKIPKATPMQCVSGTFLNTQFWIISTNHDAIESHLSPRNDK